MSSDCMVNRAAAHFSLYGEFLSQKCDQLIVISHIGFVTEQSTQFIAGWAKTIIDQAHAFAGWLQMQIFT